MIQTAPFRSHTPPSQKSFFLLVRQLSQIAAAQKSQWNPCKSYALLHQLLMHFLPPSLAVLSALLEGGNTEHHLDKMRRRLWRCAFVAMAAQECFCHDGTSVSVLSCSYCFYFISAEQVVLQPFCKRASSAAQARGGAHQYAPAVAAGHCLKQPRCQFRRFLRDAGPVDACRPGPYVSLWVMIPRPIFPPVPIVFTVH